KGQAHFPAILKRHIHRRAACCESRLQHGGRMSRSLPDRPNLEQLKKQAKTLLADARANDPSALERFRALPAFADGSVEAAALALHDAQSVIAREHGFPSWKALREEVEARTLTFEAAVDEFIRSAAGGASGRATRLLTLHPAIASSSFHAALVLGDAARVD